MAISLTSRLGLKRWSSATDEWPGREGFDAEQALLEDMIAVDGQGPISARPAAGVRGFYYYADDIEQLFRDTGTGWVPIGVDASKLVGKVPAAALPTIPLAVLPTQVPIGGGITWFGGPIPSNYAKPQGQAISRTTYSVLFTLWGTLHGAGNGTTTFNLPNVKGRSIVASDASQVEFDTVGEVGGTKTHTLTNSEMPSHSHGGVTGAGGTTINMGTSMDNPSHYDYVGKAAGSATTQYNAGLIHNHGILADGGSQPHNNLSPYFVGDYLIRLL